MLTEQTEFSSFSQLDKLGVQSTDQNQNISNNHDLLRRMIIASRLQKEILDLNSNERNDKINAIG